MQSDSSSTRSRRRAVSSKTIFAKLASLQVEVVNVHSKLDLVLGGLAIRMDKGIDSVSNADYVGYHTPQHHDGLRLEPLLACDQGILDATVAELPSKPSIPSFPLPMVIESTPRIDMTKFSQCTSSPSPSPSRQRTSSQ